MSSDDARSNHVALCDHQNLLRFNHVKNYTNPRLLLKVEPSGQRRQHSDGEPQELGVNISHVELCDIKFISTLFWTITDLSAKTTSLMNIFEPHQFFGGGLFLNILQQI